jgi:DNA-binding beta-propeller fold protein YncE
MVAAFMRRGKLILGLALAWSAGLYAAAPDADHETVGRKPDGRTVLPVNQVVTPEGRQVELPGLRPQVLALSPDGSILLTSGKTSELLVIDPSTGAIRQRVEMPGVSTAEAAPAPASPNYLKPDKEALVSYTGLVFSPDGRRVFLSNVNGGLKEFAVGADGAVKPIRSIQLPHADAPRRKEEIPSGLAFSPDGKRLYVCANLSNQLLELDADTGAVLRRFPAGVAPYDVVLCGGEAWVSNWGGRRPGAGDVTGPAGRGTVVRVDPVRFIASEGSVTVIDLKAGRELGELPAGLHASGLALSPDGRWVVCANAGADNLTVFDVRRHAFVETIWVKPNPADLFGAAPNALAFSPDGRRLYSADGSQNAVATVAFSPKGGRSKLLGFTPVNWYPGAIVYDAKRRQLCVANIKGHPAAPKKQNSGREGYNSHHYSGSLSLVPAPDDAALARGTAAVWRNLRRERIAAALEKPRPGRPARAVPERIGEPSLIHHVIYVIKENRTYDQVLGDMPSGNGNPALCVFGEHVTPNQHKLSREFVLLDNAYCAGILSADGHQWTTTAASTDYMEKSFASFPRSYPDGMGQDEVDALAYAPSGFLWDNALKHGVSVYDFGEFAMPDCGWSDRSKRGGPSWADYYDEYLHGGGKVRIGSIPGVESIRPFTPTNYVGWEMAVPDVWRARYVTNKLAQWDAAGSMPQLVFLCLPDDHTSGTGKGSPTPAACVADNDLALGTIIEALGGTRFWADTAVFVIEDDPQAGWDHVSGYRTTVYAAGPHVRRGVTVSAQYNTTSLVRTIEQILGLPPMNQFDASALPMSECFTDTPDSRPFAKVPNEVPLDQMNPSPHAISDPVLRRDSLESARFDFRRPDRAPEDALNRILWHAMRGAALPYPEWAVTAVPDHDDD